MRLPRSFSADQASQRRPVSSRTQKVDSHDEEPVVPDNALQPAPPSIPPSRTRQRASSRTPDVPRPPQPPAYPPASAQQRTVRPTPSHAPQQQIPPERPHLPYLSTQRAPRRRHPLLLAFSSILIFVFLWILFLFFDANAHLGRVDALTGAPDTPGTTYLLAGSDSRKDGPIQDNTEGQRADSIMLVNVAPNGQTTAISLPRDTWVEIPGYGWDKLNASYAYDGPQGLVSAVESLSGLTVDHYVEIGMGGVGDIVDALDGVELCLDMDVNDERSELVWESGCHTADGPTALAFSRMRYSDPLGDIGRAQRQRQVVTKTVSKALSPSTLLNPFSTLRLERAGAGALAVDDDTSSLDVTRLVLAFRQANNDEMTGTPPIDSLAYETDSGTAVLLRNETAPDFFNSLQSGTLSPQDLESASD